MSPHPPSTTGAVDYKPLQSFADIWSIAAQHFGEIVALRDPHNDPEVNLTFVELNRQLQRFAAGLQALGVQPGDRVALIADNSPRWLIADQGILMAGAVNAVRGAQADAQELAYIIEHSQAMAIVIEDQQTLTRLSPYITELPLKFIVLLSDEQPTDPGPYKVIGFNQVFQEGSYGTVRAVPKALDHLAMLMYTSGTTGRPKGVMLTHGNLLFMINNLRAILQPELGDRVLSILPTWHIFGRISDYFFLSQGCTQIYTSIRNVKKDLQTYKPHYMGSVPRLWESIYEGIQKQFRQQSGLKRLLINSCFGASQRYITAQRTLNGLNIDCLQPSGPQKLMAQLHTLVSLPLHTLGRRLIYGQVRDGLGGNFKQSVSGGGSLAMHIENFFEIVGIDLLVGYGLTETSPVLTARQPWHNLRRSSGRPIPETEIKIVDPQTWESRPPGEQGLVLVRGPQIMQGYYRNSEATTKAIDPEGWFDTGDLGQILATRDLVITGRAKDTIVLSNGENIEPQPLEDACSRSSFIDQIMVVGQDQRALGAVIVPNLEALQVWAAGQNATLALPADAPELPNPKPQGGPKMALDDPQLLTLFRQELAREVKNRPGYRADDRIGVFRFVLNPFSIENGMLTQTLKLRRPVVRERYRAMIDEMFK